MDQLAGLVLHVRGPLGVKRRHDVETALERQRGIYDAHFTDNRPQLMVVNYDPGRVSSLDILAQMDAQNVRAQRIG